MVKKIYTKNSSKSLQKVQKTILQKYPRAATLVLSLLILSLFLAALSYILSLNIFQDYKGGEKYSVSDKITYAIRCNNSRQIKMRETPPNSHLIKIPPQKYETLEQKKYILRTNKDGFLEPSFVHEKPDLKIFFIGGSTTECEYVDENFRFPYLVGRNLEKELKIKVNSENAGKSGNTTLHSINNIINKILPYDPDIIVLMEAGNDLATLIYEGSHWNNNKSKSNLVCAQKNTKNLKKGDEWSNSSWQEKVLNNEAEQQRIILEHKKIIKLFINIARAYNITPILMTQANRIENVNDFQSGRGEKFDQIYKKLYSEFNNNLREIAKEEGILLIDLAKEIPSDKKYIYDVMHFNQEGAKLVSQVITKNLAYHLKAKKFITKNQTIIK